MAHRLLPFRQYDENDVVNLFALDADKLTSSLQLMKPNDDDINADGVLVAVSAGDMTLNETVDVSEDARFANSYSSPVGRNPYPTNPLKVNCPASGEAVIGVTFRQTLSNDENGESLLFNPVKKDELNAVLSGQTVPILTKGIITVTDAAFAQNNSRLNVVGATLMNAGGGQFTAHVGTDPTVGTILASGERGGNKDNNYGGVGADSWSGKYYVIKLDC
jgi:hypothetical protein